MDFNSKNVTEAMDDFKIQDMLEDSETSNNYIFIEAGTGSGKTFYIENTLVPAIRELNYRYNENRKVLIISNRIALKLQIKRRIEDENSIYSYEDLVDVVSYQSILSEVRHSKSKQKQLKSKYALVVCDEAHFFTSDAMFNPNTYEILSTIVKTFEDSFRIYMSATLDDSLKYIGAEEFKNSYNNYDDDDDDDYDDNDNINYIPVHHKLNKKEKMEARKDKSTNKIEHLEDAIIEYQIDAYWSLNKRHFKFETNYDYLNIKYYSVYDELKNEIEKSGNEKWLIFIDNKNECKNLKQILGNSEKGQNDIFIIDSKSKNSDKYQKMILNEKLGNEIRILISTSVIDCGVNLRDVKNVVISDISKVKSIQMVGRARRTNGNEKINLYIKKFSKTYIEKILRQLNDQRQVYSDYNALQESKISKRDFLKKYYDGHTKDWENAKRLFRRDFINPDKLYVNEIAQHSLSSLIADYKDILDTIENFNEEETQRYLLEYQLSYFGKEYSMENDIFLGNTEKYKKELIEFLKRHEKNKTNIFSQKHIDAVKNKEDILENITSKEYFRNEFTRLYIASFGSINEESMSIHKIRNILKSYETNYEIGEDKNKIEVNGSAKLHCWVVNELDKGSDE